jgi:hypothetical protein
MTTGKHAPTEREMAIHCARVYLAEAKRRTDNRDFCLTLLRWAGQARREAMNVTHQLELL